MTTRGGGLPRNAPPDIFIDFLNRLAGRNVGRDVTLTLNGTSTPLQDERIGPNSFIELMPQSSAAAAITTSIYCTNRTKGNATLNHSTASATLIYTYVVIG